MNLKLTSILFFTCFAISYSQSYIGHSIDNYAGVHGVIYNPANVVSSKFRTDINLGSVSIFGGSDYATFNFDGITEGDDDFEFDLDDDANTSPSNANNFFYNADILMPSFMFNLSKRSSIGLITRVRGHLNVNSINGELFESVVNDFEDNEDFDFDSSNLSSTTHLWAEVGLAYGRILIEKPKHMLSGGVTLKYLLGGGASYFNTPGLAGIYTDANETLASQGALNVGTSFDIDENDDDYTFDDVMPGFGADIGFNYEWHPKREANDSLRHFQSRYKLKIGLSVTDIGKITYKDSKISSFDLNRTVSTTTYDSDVLEFLEDNYDNIDQDEDMDIQLPTALHLMIDYRLGKRFLLNAQANVNMVSSSKLQSNRIINTYTLTPRFESKWLSFFTPLSIREYDGFVAGAGLRFGPFSVGSGTILTNLMSDDSQTADVFVGLKIPVYRK